MGYKGLTQRPNKINLTLTNILRNGTRILLRNMPKVKGKFIHFTSVKCKLPKIVPDPNVCTRICDAVLACHETFKRGLFFLKAFCIHLQDIQIPLPTLDHSLMIVCLEQVCEKMQTGAKCQSSFVIEPARDYSDLWHVSQQDSCPVS